MFKDILVGIIATVLFEISKLIVIVIVDKAKEKSKAFSISGIWCAYHTSKSDIDGKIYSAYELVQLKIHHGKVAAVIYQITNDNRKHRYKGYGCLRGNKLSIAYEEASNPQSNHTGVFIVKIKNVIEHSIFLSGNYVEFRADAEDSSLYKYYLKPHEVSKTNMLKIMIFKSRFIYKYMQKEEFKHDAQRLS